MPIILLKFWREVLIGLLAFLLIISFGVMKYKNSKLSQAEAKCTTKIQEIEQKHIKALAEKQNIINQVSADYEQTKSEQRVQVETITREVQKIIERPIYLNRCFDDDGVQQLNSLIANGSSKSP